MPTIFGVIWFLSSLTALSQAQSNTIQVNTFFSDNLNRDWTYKIYFPRGYMDNTIAGYPVIYLLHGSEGNENSWDFIFPVLDSLISQNFIPPLLAVVPESGTSWWVNSLIGEFESAFFQDLIPQIETNYRAIKQREGRGIVGYSMGGYGAIRYSMAYSEYFGSGMILSAAIYDKQPPEASSARTSGAFGKPFDENLWRTKNYPALLENYDKKQIMVPLFIATGDDDWHHQEDVSYNVEQQAVYLYGKLHKEGGSPAELRILNGGHTESVWKKAFVEGIQYMFKYLEIPELSE